MQRCAAALAAALAVLATSGLAAEQANPLGLPTCRLPVYGETPDPNAEPDEDTAGVLLPGGTCFQLSGWAQAGYQRNRGNAPRSSNLAGRPTLERFASGANVAGATPSSITAGFTATTARIVDGMFVGMTVTGQIGDSSGMEHGDGRFTFSEGSLRVERLLVGYASSRFNFWDPGDFWTGTTYPARTVPLAAFDVWKTDSLTVTFSLERPQIPTAAVTGPGLAPVPGLLAAAATATQQRASETPDFLAAVTWEGEEWTLFAAGALRQLHVAATNATELGLAATVGASYEGEIFGASHTFSSQVSVTRNLPGYLGTAFDVQTIRSLVTGSEGIGGYSAVASIGRDITDEISVNAYASILDIEFPDALRAGTARLRSTRAAANIIYNPVEHFRIGLEYGLGRLDLHLPAGGHLPVLPPGVQLSPTGHTRVDASSLTMWVEVSF